MSGHLAAGVAGIVAARVVVVIQDLVEEVRAALESAGCEFGDMDLDEDVRYPVVWEATVHG